MGQDKEGRGALWASASLRAKVLKRIGFKQSQADPSLYTRNTDNAWLIVSNIR